MAGGAAQCAAPPVGLPGLGPTGDGLGPGVPTTTQRLQVPRGHGAVTGGSEMSPAYAARMFVLLPSLFCIPGCPASPPAACFPVFPLLHLNIALGLLSFPPHRTRLRVTANPKRAGGGWGKMGDAPRRTVGPCSGGPAVTFRFIPPCTRSFSPAPGAILRRPSDLSGEQFTIVFG